MQDVAASVVLMENANECRHEYAHGFALMPVGWKFRKRTNDSVVTVSTSDFVYGLVSCMKCRLCGHSIG